MLDWLLELSALSFICIIATGRQERVVVRRQQNLKDTVIYDPQGSATARLFSVDDAI